MVVAGAGNDVEPLVDITAIIGWQTTVVSGKGTPATAGHFPKAKKAVVAKPADVLSQISIDNQTVFLPMTHNYNYDRDLLKALLQKDCVYMAFWTQRKK